MESADGLWMPCLYIACLNFFCWLPFLLFRINQRQQQALSSLSANVRDEFFNAAADQRQLGLPAFFYDGPICWWHFLIRPSMEYFSTVGVRLPLTKNNTCLSKLQKSTGPRALRGADSVGAFPLCPVLWFHQLQDTILHSICLHLFFPNFAGRQPNVPTW